MNEKCFLNSGILYLEVSNEDFNAIHSFGQRYLTNTHFIQQICVHISLPQKREHFRIEDILSVP